MKEDLVLNYVTDALTTDYFITCQYNLKLLSQLLNIGE